MTVDLSGDWVPLATREVLQRRANLNALIRDFFASRDVLEVETPILSAAGNGDPNIASFSLRFDGPAAAGESSRWMRTSPEFALKRLVAAGVGDCYELGRVFRNGESGARHNPEFTMLEWYRTGMDHLTLMGEVAELICAALASLDRGAKVERISYRDIFKKSVDLDPMTATLEALRSSLSEFRIDPTGLTRDDWLDLVLTHLIQPTFPADQLLFLYDYPASQCALAKVRGTGVDAVAERFEAFLGPLELANGYHELTDANEQRARFESDLQRRRERNAPMPPLDTRLLSALHSGLPNCAGVALGVDRLLAAILGLTDIQATLAFPFARA